MELANKTTTYTIHHDVQIGDLTATIEAMVFYTDDNSFDVDFADVLNIKYMGIDIKGYENWQKFKKFHLDMGISFSALLDEKFEEIFTKEAVLKLIKKAK